MLPQRKKNWKSQSKALLRHLYEAVARVIPADEARIDTPRQLVSLFLPPIIKIGYRAVRDSLIARRAPEATLCLLGNYASWSEALLASVGYDHHNIILKTLEATRKVKCGEAAYEQDSALFDEIKYAWPVLAGLLWAAAINSGRLNVLDVGGSLGSSYNANRYFLDRLEHVRWNIVEQASYVKIGQCEFQDEGLRFYDSIEACLYETNPNVALLSGVLQYLEDPYRLLEVLTATPCEWLIINRTPFWEGSEERICVQHVPPEIYSASYPSWIFSLPRFRAMLNMHWETVAFFDSLDSLRAPVPVTYRGLIAVRRNPALLSPAIPPP